MQPISIFTKEKLQKQKRKTKHLGCIFIKTSGKDGLLYFHYRKYLKRLLYSVVRVILRLTEVYKV